MKGSCNNALKMLFRLGIEDLHDDEFEGSKDEDSIFREVFFGHETDKTSKKSLVTGAINFGNKKPKDVSFGCNSDTSVMTTHIDSQNMEESEEVAISARNDPEVEVKRRKVLLEEQVTAKTYIEKDVNSSIPPKIVTCRLVESSGQGIKSSCYLLKDTVVKLADKDAPISNSRLSSSETNDQKGNDASAAIASPVSEESQVSRLLVIKPEPNQPSQPNQCAKQKWKDSSFVELDEDELLSPPKESTTDPRPLLRFHINRLFRAAKWVVGRRNRTTHCKGHGEFVCKSPSGRPIRQFYRAWNMCGQKLVADASYVGDSDGNHGIQWTSLAEFQSDFYDTLLEIEEQIMNLEPATALAHWWFLLDPFAKVAFIDKSLPYLKEGKLVKTTRSVVQSSCKKLVHHQKHEKERKEKCDLNDDDLLLSAILQNRSSNKSVKKKPRLPKVPRKYKGSRSKGGCRLRPRSFSLTRVDQHQGRWSGLGVRTVLSWLIDYGVVKVNEVIQYRNPKDDLVVKDGLVTRDGIICRCCEKILSVSGFKSHAGFSLKRPCKNLFMECGKSFTLCQLEAWSAEYKVRRGATRTIEVEEIDEHDDSCGMCGDGGELICCDNCPSTFHLKCLCVEELPEGAWYCSKCSCWICGNVVNDNEASSFGALKCLQCEHKYHEECLREKGMERQLVSSATWFCGKSCKEIHSGLHSQIGIMNPISDGFSWSLLKCIHGDLKAQSSQRLVALRAECNLKLAVALTIMEECFLPMVDPRTGIDMIPQVLYNWRSEFARLNYEGFYTLILEKDDVILCVASLRIHGVNVAEMPLIATCSKYRRQGMCRHLMNAIEEMLKSLKVEKLVVSAIPSLVETWTQGFGFTPLEANEKNLAKTTLMVFPGSVWLKKPMYHGAVQSTPTEAVATPVEEMMPVVLQDGDRSLKFSLEEPEAPSKAGGSSYETVFEVNAMTTRDFQ